jgi:hypothetical protein
LSVRDAVFAGILTGDLALLPWLLHRTLFLAQGFDRRDLRRAQRRKRRRRQRPRCLTKASEKLQLTQRTAQGAGT